MLQDMENIQQEIENRITMAKQETKNLYTQIDKIKKKIQDANLFEMAKDIPSLDKKRINLKPTIDLKGHNNKIVDFRWTSDSTSILSGSQDGFMLIWDVATGLKKNAIPLDSQWLLSCAISPSGKLVASAGLNNNCTIYRISKENRVQQNVVSIFKGHTGYVSSIDFLDETQLLSASGDMTCALWDIPKAKRVREYADHLGDVLALTLPNSNCKNAKDTNIFASCGADGYVYIWDIRTPSNIQSFFVGDSDVSTIRFFKDNNSILAGSDDGSINMFDLRSDCHLASYSLSTGLQQHRQVANTYTSQSMEYKKYSNTSSPVSTISSSYLDNQGVVSIDFSNSGRLMYSCYTELGCVVWDILKAEVVGKLEGHSNRISGIRSSPDGLAVCTGSWDSTMKIWSPSYM